MLNVTLLGTGGMKPLPNRALTAMTAQCDGSTLLVDCGEGTQIALQKSSISAHDIDVICITHEHGDHTYGLLGLFQLMANSERTEPLTIVCNKPVKRWISGMLALQAPLPFKIDFQVVDKPVQSYKIGKFKVTAFKLIHTVPCYGYSIEIERKPKFDINRAKQLPIPVRAYGLLQKGECVTFEGVTYTPDMVMGEARKGIKVTYCTDTRPTNSIVENANNADLFICEAMYGDSEDNKKAREKKHLMMEEAIDMAKTANAKALWLTHYSPSMMRPQDYLDKSLDFAKIVPDGTSINIAFED